MPEFFFGVARTKKQSPPSMEPTSFPLCGTVIRADRGTAVLNICRCLPFGLGVEWYLRSWPNVPQHVASQRQVQPKFNQHLYENRPICYSKVYLKDLIKNNLAL